MIGDRQATGTLRTIRFIFIDRPTHSGLLARSTRGPEPDGVDDRLALDFT
jgi:hypothetical protein